MRLNELFLWFVADPAKPQYVGALNLVAAGKRPRKSPFRVE